MPRKRKAGGTASTEGRDRGGRFARGNKLGKGNPVLRRISRIRSAMDAAVTDADVREIVAALVAQARNGNVEAIREFFDRSIGKPHKEHRAVAGFELGETPKSLSELLTLHGRLIQATTRGEVSTDDAKLLGDMIGGALKVAELAELEARVKALEGRRTTEPTDEP